MRRRLERAQHQVRWVVHRHSPWSVGLAAAPALWKTASLSNCFSSDWNSRSASTQLSNPSCPTGSSSVTVYLYAAPWNQGFHLWYAWQSLGACGGGCCWLLGMLSHTESDIFAAEGLSLLCLWKKCFDSLVRLLYAEFDATEKYSGS